jgi:hypothetical protein
MRRSKIPHVASNREVTNAHQRAKAAARLRSNDKACAAYARDKRGRSATPCYSATVPPDTQSSDGTRRPSRAAAVCSTYARRIARGGSWGPKEHARPCRSWARRLGHRRTWRLACQRLLPVPAPCGFPPSSCGWWLLWSRLPPSPWQLILPRHPRAEGCDGGPGDHGSMHRLRPRPHDPHLHPSSTVLRDGGQWTLPSAAA